MPFYYDGVCAQHLRALGFTDVVHTDEDFFERVQDRSFMDSVDLIWDNPPYTMPEMKERVLRALCACEKPFVMLLPISILHVGFVREIVDLNAVQVIIPRRVHVKKQNGDELPFKYLCWLCYKTQLSRDLVLLNDDDEQALVHWQAPQALQAPPVPAAVCGSLCDDACPLSGQERSEKRREVAAREARKIRKRRKTKERQGRKFAEATD